LRAIRIVPFVRDRERFASRRRIRQHFDKPTLSPRQSVRAVASSQPKANIPLTNA
jgi:hypothetical protein